MITRDVTSLRVQSSLTPFIKPSHSSLSSHLPSSSATELSTSCLPQTFLHMTASKRSVETASSMQNSYSIPPDSARRPASPASSPPTAPHSIVIKFNARSPPLQIHANRRPSNKLYVQHMLISILTVSLRSSEALLFKLQQIER